MVDVSIITPVLNEERHLREVVERMLAQRYAGEIEFLLVDGGSTDATPRILEEVARADARIRVLHNPARTTPAALNVGLGAARGDYVVRMDAHSHYPDEYVAAGIARLREGDVACVSGPALAEGYDVWSRRVALALRTAMGVGGADFRRGGGAEYEVDSGFCGVWRRETLVRHGGWDEEAVSDEDFELAARVRQAGGRIVCLPEMAAVYVPRNSLPRLARQYAAYGFARVRTSLRHPESTRPSHLLPPALAVTAVAAAAAPAPLRGAARMGMLAYAAALAASAARVAREAPARDVIALPAVYVTMHLAYGTGALIACVRIGVPLAGVRAAVARAARRLRRQA